MKKTTAFYTLGCKVNQYESNAMSKLFEDAGYTIVPFDSMADVYVVNTCTVTQVGDKKSRQYLRRAKKQNPNAVVAAVGCLAQISPEEIKKTGVVDVIIGTNNKNKIVEAVEQAMAEKATLSLVSDISRESAFEDMSLDTFYERQRAYVKIQEGCDRFCSYCIIPYARGRVRSRAPESIIKEVTALAQNGFLEVVLTGIHVASYGKDSGLGLLDIIKKVNEIDGILRIRLSSIDPEAFTDEFIDEIAGIEKLCPHFHISLQSGSDYILKRMNRRYTTAQYAEVLSKLRERIKDVSITTDIITGFPYETEEEFRKGYEFVLSSRLCGAHVFPYSERANTPAAKFPCRVEKEVRSLRAHEMAELCRRLRQEFVSGFVGREMEVLFEQKNSDGLYEGFTPNYIRTFAKSENDISGKIYTVKITQAKEGELYGELA